MSDAWEQNAACFPPLVSIFWQWVQRRGESEGTLPCKVFFHVFAKWVLPLPLHPWNGELRGRSQCAGTVCSDWLTNLTTDWLWKWLSFVPPVPSSPRLLPLPVSLSFPYFFCLSELIFFHSYTPSPPTARDKSGGKVINVMRRRENNTQGDGESCRDEGDENKTNGEECTKGNEAKRKRAAERSMITR